MCLSVDLLLQEKVHFPHELSILLMFISRVIGYYGNRRKGWTLLNRRVNCITKILGFDVSTLLSWRKNTFDGGAPYLQRLLIHTMS